MQASEKGFIPPVPYLLEINTLVVEFELVRYRQYVVKIAVHGDREEISDGYGCFRGEKVKITPTELSTSTRQGAQIH